MGDRGNIKLVGKQCFPHPLYLYTHWGGYQMKDDLAEALAKGERWGDPQYLSRIIFQTMLHGDDGATGFGLSTALQDNGNPLLVVDLDAKTIWEEAEPGGRCAPGKGRIITPISFDDFLKQHKPTKEGD